ncbi:MAG: hypothetical protein ACD_10C00687G0001, partial [uncultured bacterium]
MNRRIPAAGNADKIAFDLCCTTSECRACLVNFGNINCLNALFPVGRCNGGLEIAGNPQSLGARCAASLRFGPQVDNRCDLHPAFLQVNCGGIGTVIIGEDN